MVNLCGWLCHKISGCLRPAWWNPLWFESWYNYSKLSQKEQQIAAATERKKLLTVNNFLMTFHHFQLDLEHKLASFLILCSPVAVSLQPVKPAGTASGIINWRDLL